MTTTTTSQPNVQIKDNLSWRQVIETANRVTNYGTWGKRKKTVVWTHKETVRFFKALSIFGTDFTMMKKIFKQRTKHQLKLKYKKEEKLNRALIDKWVLISVQSSAPDFTSSSSSQTYKFFVIIIYHFGNLPWVKSKKLLNVYKSCPKMISL